MPFKMQPTNRPKIGLDGYCKGKIVKVELVEESEEFNEPSVKWTVESQGVLRPITNYFYTRVSYNVAVDVSEEETDNNLPLFEHFADKRLNIAANVLKQLGLLSEEIIEQVRSGDMELEDVEIDLEESYGVPLRYKFVRKNGQYRIDRSSIERLVV